MDKNKNKPAMGGSVGNSGLDWQRWQNKRLAKEEDGWEALRRRKQDEKRKFFENLYKVNK